MKSGLCLMLDLARHGAPARVNLTLVFYAGEEGPYLQNELESVLAGDSEVRRAHAAVLLEPTDNYLELGCGGSVHARVRFLGKSAHSARPWQGKNAIIAALPLLEKLRDLPLERYATEGLEWTRVTTLTLAQGGRARNVVPDWFELNLNHRFGPETTVAESERILQELVGPEPEFEIVDRSPAAPPCRHHPMVAAWEGTGVRGIRPKLGYTDVARFHARGICAVNFGPGTVAQAHQANEWASVSALVAGWAMLHRWLSAVSR
jgi:succinyl-diaminopimelate desuccinylase